MTSKIESSIQTCGFARTQSYGGSGGGGFSDNLTETCRLVGVNLRSGSRIDGIQAVWSTPSGGEITGTWHGGAGGSPHEFRLAADEYITRIDGRSGTKTDQLKFTTNKGTVYGPFGGSGGTAFAISEVKVGGFFGRSGSELDDIGFFTPGQC